MVNWLTHAAGATRADGRLALDATLNVVAAFGDALVRYERSAPERCPTCASYKLAGVYRPDIEPPYVTVCVKCGWGDRPRAAEAGGAPEGRTAARRPARRGAGSQRA